MAGGRPLSAAPTRVGNRWRVELPVAPGSAKRRRRTFATKKQAEEYLNEALRAWDGGTPAPPPDPAPAGRRSQAAATPAAPAPSAAPAAGEASDQAGVATFAEVAAAWHTSRYFKSHRGQPERAADVAALIANHLHTFMDAHGFADGSDLTGEAYEDFLVDVAYGPTDDEDDGGDVDGTGQEAPPVPGDEQCLTVARRAKRRYSGASTPAPSRTPGWSAASDSSRSVTSAPRVCSTVFRCGPAGLAGTAGSVQAPSGMCAGSWMPSWPAASPATAGC